MHNQKRLRSGELPSIVRGFGFRVGKEVLQPYRTYDGTVMYGPSGGDSASRNSVTVEQYIHEASMHFLILNACCLLQLKEKQAEQTLTAASFGY